MTTHIKSVAPPPARCYPWQVRRPPKTIGVIEPCYGSSHVIYGLRTRRYAHRTLTALPLHKLVRQSTFHKFTPFIVDASVPLVHTWNSIPRNKDFIVSFELELPRYLGYPTEAQIRYGLGLLASGRCKKILALSDFAYGFAERRFEKYGYRQLVDKMSVFRGAIRDPYEDSDLIDNRGDRPPFAEKPLSAVVIGTQLFRKGGMHAIQAFERLRANGINVVLTLIGDFEIESYAFGSHIPNAGEWRHRALSHDWIRFQGPIPNAQVFPELLAHDICIYTSLDESLGWLPIEAGMLGVPVLANKVCAFPELVSDRETGWLIDLPLRGDGRWGGLELDGVAAKEALDHANDAIVAGIEECMTYVHEHPEMLRQWGANGRRMIKSMYDMEHASQNLERIYDEILAD